MFARLRRAVCSLARSCPRYRELQFAIEVALNSYKQCRFCRCYQLSQLSFACIALCLLEIAFFFQGIYSRKCAFHGLLITSATYTECAFYLAPANDRQPTGSSK